MKRTRRLDREDSTRPHRTTGWTKAAGGRGLRDGRLRPGRLVIPVVELSRPHPDNPRYVAAIVAVRYQGFTELVIRKSIVPFVLGCLLGAAAGSGLSQYRQRKQLQPSDVTRPGRFTLLELLVVTGLVGVLVAMLAPIGGTGLVYYDGKDQFHWLEQLEFGPEPGRPTAITALCSLLEGKPFPCRSTIIPALARCGGDARPAIPVLEELATDTEESVKTAAADALLKLKSVAEPSSQQEPPVAPVVKP